MHQSIPHSFIPRTPNTITKNECMHASPKNLHNTKSSLMYAFSKASSVLSAPILVHQCISFPYPCSYTIESYVHPPCLLTLSLPSKSLLTSSSVNRSCPVQLALDVLARNLCHLSLLLLNTSSMFSGPGCPNIVAGSMGSCLAIAFRRAGESVQLGASKFSSAESSSSESVWISGSSIFSPF